jgi:chain length determinant protein tyrosine kinase EpsG
MSDRVRPLHRPAEANEGRLGDHLVEMGRISPADVERILAAQTEMKLPFGRTAERLGLISEADLRAALARQFSFPALLDRDNPHYNPELVTALWPEHPASESMRRLRAQINLRSPSAQDGRMLAVVSAEPKAGRSFIAANLAVAFAQSNVRTLLIDLDLRSPRQHAIFRSSNARGVSTILSGRLSLDQVETDSGLGALSVLRAGPSAPNPQELLESWTMTPMLEALRSRYQLIIADTPAWCNAADAQLISALAGSAVVVACPDKTSESGFREMVGAIRVSGAQIVGCVMNSP